MHIHKFTDFFLKAQNGLDIDLEGLLHEVPKLIKEAKKYCKESNFSAFDRLLYDVEKLSNIVYDRDFREIIANYLPDRKQDFQIGYLNTEPKISDEKLKAIKLLLTADDEKVNELISGLEPKLKEKE